MLFYEKNFITNGEVLQDLTKNGKDRGWCKKKKRNWRLAKSYERLRMEKRAERVSICGSALKFAACPKEGRKKLLHAKFCRDRLCAMCIWRRSYKLQCQIMRLVHAVSEVRELRYIFLTLTVRNCTGADMPKTLDTMLEGFNRLIKYKAVKDMSVGWIRCLEVTRNNDTESEWYGTYHPHIHVLIAVESAYFGQWENYINQRHWIALWRRACKLDYDPDIKVNAVQAKREGQTAEAAVVETAKYPVKSSNYMHRDKKVMDEIVMDLLTGLSGRRLIGYGGL